MEEVMGFCPAALERNRNMMQEEMKIAISKKNLVVFLCLFSVMEFASIRMIFYTEYIRLGVVFAISLFMICFFAVLTALLFYVKVNGANIEVRTRLGRKYRFDCSDIEEVIYFKRNSVRYGPSFYITLLTETKKVVMEGTMTDFDKMVEYILEKHNNGEINKKAVSELCKKKLFQYSKNN